MIDRQQSTRMKQLNGPFSASLDMLIKNMADTGRGRKQAVTIAADMSMAAVCLWLAYTLRHGLPFSDFRTTWYLFIALPILTAVIFGGFGVYRWVIRSSNLRLYKQLLKGSVVSGFLLLTAFFLIPPERANPRSLFVIYSLLLIAGTIGMRMTWRSIFDTGNKGEPIAIFGAGSGGRQLAGLLREGGEYRPLAFIDDDPALAGSTLSGLPVLAGNNVHLKAELKKLDAESIVLAMPSISSSVYQQKLLQIDELGFRILTMPSVEELINGKSRVDEIRDVSINDILGRQEVPANYELMGRKVTGKTVLVTGGGGSIGSELCRQIMKLKPAHLVIVDNCEANLYHITEELDTRSGREKVDGLIDFTALIGSVRDKQWIHSLFKKFQFDTVYHAAAYKHVPIVEAQPDQGVSVNVFGTLTVLDAAINAAVSNFVLISTDKAVRPTNAMGGSKRIAELILQAKAEVQSATNISMVRFGNVLGSSGSVVPKFKKQIENGGPITLTHAGITRYFMTIPEAAQLVLQASAIAKGGDVFVLDMGEPVRIEDLAKTMVRLYGKKLRRDTNDPNDIEIIIEGLRPGEKMYEELFLSGSCVCTSVGKIFTAKEDWLDWKELKIELAKLQNACAERRTDSVKEIVRNLAFLDEYKAVKAVKKPEKVESLNIGNKAVVGDTLM